MTEFTKRSSTATVPTLAALAEARERAEDLFASSPHVGVENATQRISRLLGRDVPMSRVLQVNIRYTGVNGRSAPCHRPSLRLASSRYSWRYSFGLRRRGAIY
jgi:hypothetical protein